MSAESAYRSKTWRTERDTIINVQKYEKTYETITMWIGKDNTKPHDIPIVYVALVSAFIILMYVCMYMSYSDLYQPSVEGNRQIVCVYVCLCAQRSDNTVFRLSLVNSVIEVENSMYVMCVCSAHGWSEKRSDIIYTSARSAEAKNMHKAKCTK